MSWLGVFSACLAAMILGGAITVLVVAWLVGRQTSRTERNPLQAVIEKQAEYPVNEDGELKGMEPESDEEYEPQSVRL